MNKKEQKPPKADKNQQTAQAELDELRALNRRIRTDLKAGIAADAAY